MGMSTAHNPVLVSRSPLSTILFCLFLISTAAFVNVALQSLSHSWSMERRLPVFKSSNTQALFAVVGRLGMASCVSMCDLIACPLGQPTVGGGAGVIVFIFHVFMM